MSIEKNNEITLSIVIPTLNRSDNLTNALNAILRQSLPPKEIIVVDQSDNSDTKTLVDRSTRIFLEKTISLKYMWESTKSITHARNVGARAALGDTVLFMDDDMIPHKHYVREILKVFKNKSSAVGVQGYLFPPPTWTGFSTKANFMNIFCRTFFLTHLEKNKQKILLSGDITVAYPLNKTIEATIIFPSLSAFKREVLLQIPLDEKLLGYSWQEEYFTLKLSQLYHNCLFVTPFATIFHDAAHHGRPIGKRLYYITASYELYNFVSSLRPSFKNWIAFFWKWIGRIILSLFTSRSKNYRAGLIYTFGSCFWVHRHFDEVRNARFNL